MKARNEKPLIIAGGGIGGLAAALALARKGFRSVVLEQAPQFGEIGAGIQIAPNAWHALDALGVGALVKKEAVFVEHLFMFDGVSGEMTAPAAGIASAGTLEGWFDWRGGVAMMRAMSWVFSGFSAART